MFDLQDIYFSLLLKWIKEGSFYWDASCDSPPSILEKIFMIYVFCFVKKSKVKFLNLFVSKKIHISYFFSFSKIINKIFRFHHYIWCAFSFFINKNAKIKTKIYNFSLMINNYQIIMLYKSSICITIHHAWKAGKLYYDVKKEMALLS